MTTITRNDILMGLAVVTVFVMGGLIMAYGVIIGAWLSAIATITAIGAGGAVAIGLAYGAGLVAFRGAYGAIRLGYHAAMSKEALEQAKAESAMKWAMVDKQRADTALVTTQAMYQFHSVSGAAILVSNGRAEILHLPSQQSAPMPLLGQGGADLPIDDQKLFELFAKAKAIHALILGSRNSGKSTLVNRLMNVEFSSYDTVIVDILFNEVDSGWLLPSGAKVSREFVPTLREFYASHKKLVDTVTTSRRGGAKKLLVIDEFPSLLASLKATDKKQYDDVMAMLRSIYSNGSHTNHNVILLSQTVLSEDIGLSSNDKGNFIQVALGSLAGDYLALRRGKSGNSKKAAYERLTAIANDYEFYACYEDASGALDVQPLPDLSQFGAKRLYGLSADSIKGESQADNDGAADCPSDENEGDSTMTMVVDKPSILGLPIMSEGEAAIIQAASELLAQGGFSFNKLHCKLTGVKVSGGKQNDAYKTILAKFGLIEAVTSQRT